MTMDHLYIRVNTDKVSPLVITEIAPGVNAAWSKVGNEKTLVGVEIITPVVSILLNGTTLYPSPPAQEGEASRYRRAIENVLKCRGWFEGDLDGALKEAESQAATALKPPSVTDAALPAGRWQWVVGQARAKRKRDET